MDTMLRNALWGFLRPLVQLVTNLLSPEVGEEWEREFKKFLRKELCWMSNESTRVPAAKPQPALFSVIATTILGNVAGKRTKSCFAGSRYPYNRDADFDNWLPASQPNMTACTISTLAPSQDWTFVEAAAVILNVPITTPIKQIGQMLIERGHTMTMPQGEVMIEKTESGEKTDMPTNGYGTFFLVENEDGSVSVGRVSRVERVWRAYVHRLGHDTRWYADYRLLIRNLKDPSNL